MGDKVIRYIDLFAGMGGIRIGLEQALEEKGFKGECVLTSEIKPSAMKVYEDNFGKTEFHDIIELKTEDIPDFDILLAGFSCQPFSFAGKRLGFEDKTRGTLFFEIARILKDKQPQAFLLENVEGLVKHDMSKEDRKMGKEIGRTLEVILDTLEEIGYKVSWKVLQASDFGVAQIRRRIYIVGTLDKEVDLDITSEYPTIVFKDIQEHNLETLSTPFTKAVDKFLKDKGLGYEFLYGKAIRDKRGSSNNIHSWTLGLRGPVTDKQHDFLEEMVTQRRKKEFAVNKGRPIKDGLGLTIEEIRTFSDISIEELEDLVDKKYLKFEILDNKWAIYDINGGKLSFEFAKILDPNKVSLTLVATDALKMAVVDNNGLRRLTLREGLRLNGFPEWYKLDIEYRKGFDLLGNTVVVPVIKEISKKILDSIS